MRRCQMSDINIGLTLIIIIIIIILYIDIAHQTIKLSPMRWMRILMEHECFYGRPSRPRHCSKDAQPVPKAVYCSDTTGRGEIRTWVF